MSTDQSPSRDGVEPTEADLQRAVAARALPQMPEHLGQGPGRLDLSGPSEPVASSYASQRYRVVDDELAEYLLQPMPVRPEHPECDEVVDLPTHFVSGWHAHGRPSTVGECQQGHDALHNALLAAAHYPVRQAVSYPPDQTWFEQAHLAGGLPTSRPSRSGGRSARPRSCAGTGPR